MSEPCGLSSPFSQRSCLVCLLTSESCIDQNLFLDSNFVFILELNVVDCVILCSMRESTFFFIYVQQIDQKRFEVHFYSFQVETFYVN